MRKKLISIFMAIAMIFTSVGIPVFGDTLELKNNSDLINQQTEEFSVTPSPAVVMNENNNTVYKTQSLQETASPEPTADTQETGSEISLMSVEDLTESLNTGAVTITESGQYSISNLTTANSITVKSGVSAELTIDGLNITSVNSSPVKLESGAQLTLHVNGENTLSAGTKYYAGIAVLANNATSDFSSLVIDGSGKLNVTVTSHAAAIGTNRLGTEGSSINGKITINGGIITATGGTASAGIGSGQNGSPGCDIEINGGIITATGGSKSPGIGGAGAYSNPKIIINGGYLKAVRGDALITHDIGPGYTASSSNSVIINGGSVNASAISPAPVDKFGTGLRQIVLAMPDAAEMANKEVTVGTWTASTDENAKLYVYVSSATTSYSVQYGEKVYYISGITEETSEYTLTEYSGSQCICTNENSSVTLSMPDTVNVNKIAGEESVKLSAVFNSAEGCTYPIHSLSTSYTLTNTDGTAVDSAVAELTDGYMKAYYSETAHTVRLKVDAVMNGIDYFDKKDIEIKGDNTSRFNLSDGNIEISANGTDNMTVKSGSSSYVLPKTTKVHIYQTTQTTDYTITVSGVDAEVALENVNISTIITNPIKIGDSVNLTLDLIGNNKISATNVSSIQGIRSTSALTLGGSGSLEITSGVGAGIGNVKKVTINGGTITARGGNGGAEGSGGAGIGGGSDGAGCEVIVNGGRVYAYGSGNAAGIGGGESATEGGGGDFTINGGMVEAKSGGNGCGIGYGGKKSTPGTITFNGGSVNASLGLIPNNGRNQYLVTLDLENVSGQHDVTYSIGEDNSNPIATSTDKDGKLYLYLNAGRQWIRVYKGGQTYYRYMTVEANDTNKSTCVLNPAARLNSFNISGQIGESIIDHDNLTVEVTVPYNIDPTKITPLSTYTGAETNPVAGTSMNFSNESHSAEYTIIGDDMQEKKYTVTLNIQPAPSEPQADIYDISKGSIKIRGAYIEYGGTKYKTNTVGYIITGTTIENTIIFENPESQLPPVTFRDLNIALSSEYAVPITAMSGADITVEGICSIRSSGTYAMEIKNEYFLSELALSFMGSGRMTIQGAASSSAVYLRESSTKMTVTGVTSSILSAAGINALSGQGSFYTDSETYMRITSADTPEIQPKNVDEAPLYQLTAHIKAEDKSATTAVYNSKVYYVGNDATLYLMLPDNQYKMTVTYGGSDFDGNAEINGAPAEITLHTIKVTDVEYSYDGTVYRENINLPYSGGTVDFAVTGTLVPGNVKIRLKSDDASMASPEQTVTEIDGVNKASFTLPENQSYLKEIVYTVYYDIKGKETELPYKIIIYRNNTICSIEKFKIDGQIGNELITESETNGNTIVINMPYDHVFTDYYAASAIDFIGSKVVPAVGTMSLFVDTGQYARSYYTVTARDNTTTKRYEVKLYKQTTPKITSLSIGNTVTCDGGKVKITARGIALGNVASAEQEANREVYIYSDNGIDPVKAQMQLENGVYSYVAELDVPENTSDTEDALYPLKAKIGSTEQTGINSDIACIRVPRQERGLVGIKEFIVEHQIGTSEITSNKVNVTMPYDADVTAILPNVVLEDIYASYTPITEQDFTNDVKYTVTAENGAAKDYTVRITKQDTPVADSIEFTNPRYSGAGRVQVKINGQHLENAANAINLSPYIIVNGTLSNGDATDSDITPGYAVLNDDGDYVATIVVPRNNSNQQRTYTLSVEIGGRVQTLTGNAILTVPAKEANSKELTDIILTDNQSPLTVSGEDIYLYVPYNTDLSNIEPTVYHTGVSYSPTGAQNFNNVVQYTVIAQDDTVNTYKIHVLRSGAPKVENITKNKPANFSDCDITIDITGQFIPYLTEGVEMDKMTISAVLRSDTSEVINGSIDYDESVYGGHATGRITLPINESSVDKIYDIKIYINGVEQMIGLSGTITVPRRKARTITDFRVNGQIGSTQITEDDVNGNTIWFTMPYNTDLTSLLPRITIDGDSYTPTDAQDFESGKSDESKPVTYTVSAEADTDRTYTARVLRDGLPSISSVKITNTPTTFVGKTINVDVEGVFFYGMKVKAVSADGSEEIEGTVTMDEWHKASATIEIPTNYDTAADKEYRLVFHLDNFEDEIIYSSPVKITVPRRKTRAITNFTITNQVGVATITDTDIYVQVEYNTNLRELSSTVTIDGDSYTPTGIQNFDNETKSLVYTVSAADDEDRNYTVHISRDGKPTISKLTFLSPINFRGGSVVVNFEGIFFETAEVSVVPVDGGAEIAGTITSFNEGKATGVVNIPTNYDTENEKVYQLKFVIDGMITSYIGGTEITVPRRTTREITEFSLPDIQEGDTRIEGTSIYIDVPYHLDIKSVTPEFTYDADSITPEGAQNFSDLDNPVKYTLSSSGDDAVTYTVYITRIGNDPYLKSMTVENQAKETEYLEDTINIVLKSNAKIKEVEPILDFDGMDYTPRGPQDFSSSKKEPLVYTVFNKYGIEHKYYVTITKKSSGGGGSSVKSTPKPTPTPTLEPTIEPTIEPTDEPSVTPAPTPTAQPKVKPYIKGYDEDGVMYFRPDNTITRAEVATILSLLDEDFNADTLYQDVFPDIAENAWYRNYMNFAIGKGYISGYDDGTSRPDNMITRAEFASMIARYMDISPADGEDRFSDIAEFDWCRQQINALADMGIVSGYDGGMFLPDNLISRAETVAMINRMLGREMTEEILERINCPFDDITSSHWAYNDVLLASCEY